MKQIAITAALLVLPATAVASDVTPYIEAYASAAYDCKFSVTMHQDDQEQKCGKAHTLMGKYLDARDRGLGKRPSARDVRLINGANEDYKAAMILRGEM